MNTASVNGQQVAYDDAGGDGLPMVLAHGFLMDRSMFDSQVAALRPGCRVITWDAHGFGNTVFDGRPFTYWDLAADCIALLDHLGIRQAVVGGMSQGGFVSLRVALAAPERVRALVLLDTQAGTEDPEVVPLYQGMLDDWVANGPSDDIASVTAGLILGEAGLNEAWIARWKARAPRSVGPSGTDPHHQGRRHGQAGRDHGSRLGGAWHRGCLHHHGKGRSNGGRAVRLCGGRAHRGWHPLGQSHPPQAGQRGHPGLSRITAPVGAGSR